MQPEKLRRTSNPERCFTLTNSAIWLDDGWKVHARHGEPRRSAYVTGRCHTNGLENFWSLLKRGIGGTYIAVEPFHLFRYIDEQAFRFNNRKHVDGELKNDYERFKAALNQVVGRRLTYQALIGKEAQNASSEEAF